jgi:hypothetical protein
MGTPFLSLAPPGITQDSRCNGTVTDSKYKHITGYSCGLLFAGINVSALLIKPGCVTVTVMGTAHQTEVCVNTNATKDERWRAPSTVFHSGLRYKPH